ncbi:MAG: hypothetical protein P4M05_22765 [Bradyrhizobium sp.]|nr:hypothetical protein [Bradyrhizobium sp.]
MMERGKAFEKQAAEQARKHAYGQEETGFTGDPAAAVSTGLRISAWDSPSNHKSRERECSTRALKPFARAENRFRAE